MQHNATIKVGVAQTRERCFCHHFHFWAVFASAMWLVYAGRTDIQLLKPAEELVRCWNTNRIKVKIKQKLFALIVSLMFFHGISGK